MQNPYRELITEKSWTQCPLIKKNLTTHLMEQTEFAQEISDNHIQLHTIVEAYAQLDTYNKLVKITSNIKKGSIIIPTMNRVISRLLKKKILEKIKYKKGMNPRNLYREYINGKNSLCLATAAFQIPTPKTQ